MKQPVVLEEAQLLRQKMSSAAPSRAPGTVPMPPSTTAASRSADGEELVGVGLIASPMWALIGAGDAGEEGADGEREQLERGRC